MGPPVNIFVHVSGPSRGADDTRYRLEVQGYLNFESVERHTISEAGSEQQGNPEKNFLCKSNNVESGPQQPYQGLQGRHQLQLTPPISSSTRPKSPAITTTHTFPSVSRSNRIGTPAMSSPKPISAFPRTSVKETPLLLIEQTPAIFRPRTAPAVSPSTRIAARRRAQSDSWHTPPSVIPDSQPTPSSVDQPFTSSSPYLKRHSDFDSPSPSRSSLSPNAKRQRVQDPSSSLPQEEPLAENLPGFTSSSLDPHFESSPPSICVETSSEVHPAKPRIGTGKFKTHLTSSLVKIREHEQASRHEWFNPVLLTRNLNVLERGHWLISINSWDQKTKSAFWNDLKKWIGEGHAGWGVWSIREMVEDVFNKDSNEENQAHGNQLEVAKVYCWGEVLREIWLVLLMASRKKINGIGAKWIDAGDVVVVVMK